MCWVRQGQMPVVLKRFIKGSDCELDIIFVSHGTHGIHGFLLYAFLLLIEFAF